MENHSEEKIDYIYCSQVLKSLDYSNSVTSPAKLSKNLKLRPLQTDDYHKGYLELLSQLTDVGTVDEKQFIERFNQMKSDGKYYITVIEDCDRNRVICSATLFTEYKFIHNASKRARIEDVVVDSDYRGQRLGHLIIETLKLLAQKLDCYKLTLDCRDEMIGWYNKLGFIAIPTRANMLTIRFIS
ncbi:probable glucosamine 6-phosphate N-acetyltransferase [Oppia nitens]|uniref:probable glucosamine 6-phosphate N-acetyltransferase n=1 Tax=Oppia nitens TaxID=1686743 RepID=UPI0023DB1CDE|nr:probable glucosamine 6-phosphate N-acetyltransferase [Oppia nitens]